MTVEPASVELPVFFAALDACDTVIVWAPFASVSSDRNVEKPRALPPAATKIDACAATVVVVSVMMFVERMLPALASASTVNESVPLNVPLPAVTPAMLSFDDVAASVFHDDGRASASAAVLRPVKSVRISP